jgi:hypothetical protein
MVRSKNNNCHGKRSPYFIVGVFEKQLSSLLAITYRMLPWILGNEGSILLVRALGMG